MIKLMFVCEVDHATSLDEARDRVDAFRESVHPSDEYGLTFYDPDSAGPGLYEAVREWREAVREHDRVMQQYGSVSIALHDRRLQAELRLLSMEL